MSAFRHIRRSVAIGSLMFVPALEAVSRADTVVVSPYNMNGWAFGSFDGNFNPVSSGDYFGTAEMVNGPATPPLGTGSAHLATNAGFGDGTETLGTDNFDGTTLGSITSLSYWSYMAENNGQQFPYLNLFISTDGNPIASDGSNLDIMQFEPPYQQTNTGNPNLPNQAAPVLDEWQSWDALNGGWYDGTIGGDGGDNVQPISAFLAAYPDATIEDPSIYFPGFDGVELQVGGGEPGDSFDGNVDDFTLGTAGGSITDDFEVPEPASTGLILVGGAAALMRRRRTQQ